ncbi:MAG TPA: hypothetical protein VF137_04265 [Candidatus Dormibacteraeota bacterium]
MKQGRRAVLDDARRRVERALMMVPAAEELAAAAKKVVESEGEPVDLDELRTALAKFERIISS